MPAPTLARIERNAYKREGAGGAKLPFVVLV